ncbi:MAG: aminotransferase class IV [Nitrospira sp.]|nr:aminotransferase class IV [Nitrospira sp.]
MWVYLNNRIVQAERARISVFDRGFLYGDGVFETVRIHEGRPVWLDRHLTRLAGSCRQIRMPLPEKPWPAIFQKVIDKNRVDDALIRLTLSRGTRNPGGDGRATPDAGANPTIVLFPRPLPALTPSQRRKGVKLTLATVRRPLPRSCFSQAKTLNYLNNLLAKQEAEERGAFEALMLTTGGHLAECSMSNLFFIRDKTLYTPSLACGVLPGITRGVVLDVAPTLGLQTREGRYRPEVLHDADECFLTSSGVGILPVREIEGHSLPKQTARSWTAVLQTRYEQLLSAHGR